MLKTHQETHTGERAVKCKECDRRYSCKSALVKHMEEHTGVYKTIPCDFCDRVFRNSYNMKNHRRTHTGEKPYRCDVCNYNSTTKSQLDRHMKTTSHKNLAFEQQQMMKSQFDRHMETQPNMSESSETLGLEQQFSV